LPITCGDKTHMYGITN